MSCLNLQPAVLLYVFMVLMHSCLWQGWYILRLTSQGAGGTVQHPLLADLPAWTLVVVSLFLSLARGQPLSRHIAKATADSGDILCIRSRSLVLLAKYVFMRARGWTGVPQRHHFSEQRPHIAVTNSSFGLLLRNDTGHEEGGEGTVRA